MLLSHLKIALRFLSKNRSFFVINTFGLTTAFTCFILITLYIHDELHFDLFHNDSDRMVRIIQQEQQDNGETRKIGTVAARLAPEALRQLPEVEDAIRVSGFGRLTMGNDPANRDYETIIIADSNFFRFFDFQLIQGDPLTALTIPDGVVLSEKLAQKYFGKENALGKRLFTNVREMTVTGVMKDYPKNSHLQLDLIYSEATWKSHFPWYSQFEASDWESNSFITYLKLKKGANRTHVEEKLTSLVKNNYDKEKEFKSYFSLQPFRDIHLHSQNIQGYAPEDSAPSPFYLYMFGIVAFLIVVIACLNYMNLSTALAFRRTREIGTRKTLGAGKGQLILQFIAETMVIAFASLLLAIAITTLVLPSVNEFTNKEMVFENLPAKWFVLMGAVVVSAALLSSLYPAFIVSKVAPAEALKREVRLGRSSVPVRKLLVIAQFCISVIMISSTIVIYQQLQYMKTKDLGFALDDLVVVDINSGTLRRSFEAIKDEFGKLSEVHSVTVSSRVPGEWKSFPYASVQAEADKDYEMIFVGIDKDFLKTYQIPLLEGRNFANTPGDSLKVILTRFAVEQLKLEHPVGATIEIPAVRWGGDVETMDTPMKVEVIGVCENFYFESFRQKMMPLVFGNNINPIQNIDYYTLRISTTNWDETITKLKGVNDKFDADNPLEYTFLDGRFKEFYESDEKRSTIFLAFSSVIVLIACLGLFALVSFSVESRSKEIGIRKILGASIQNITMIISREFLLLVIIGTLISIPITYYFMNEWLQQFAYHITMSAGVFTLAGVLAIMIAFVTILIRILRAALSNPIDSLKAE